MLYEMHVCGNNLEDWPLGTASMILSLCVLNKLNEQEAREIVEDFDGGRVKSSFCLMFDSLWVANPFKLRVICHSFDKILCYLILMSKIENSVICVILIEFYCICKYVVPWQLIERKLGLFVHVQ